MKRGNKTKAERAREANGLLKLAPNAETIEACRDRLAEVGEVMIPTFQKMLEHVSKKHEGLLQHLWNVKNGCENPALKQALQENDMPTALRRFRESLGEFEEAWTKYHKAVEVASLYGL